MKCHLWLLLVNVKNPDNHHAILIKTQLELWGWPQHPYSPHTQGNPVIVVNLLYLQWNNNWSFCFVGTCFGEPDIYTESGFLYSHNGFGNYSYSDNMRCNYTIHGSPDSHVQLKFNSFDLEGHSTCNYDDASFYNVPDSGSPQLIRMSCGHSAQDDITSSTQKVLVSFKTDGSVVRQGFNISFQSTRKWISLLDWMLFCFTLNVLV